MVGGKKLHLSQAKYAENVLERFGMNSCKPVVSPLSGQVTMSDVDGGIVDRYFYQQLIGSAI